MNPEYVHPVEAEAARNVAALESGKILFWPAARFDLLAHEQRFLSPALLAGGSKNVSYDPESDALGGTSCEKGDRERLREMMRRFSGFAREAIERVCAYGGSLRSGRTSFRPAEIAGRETSWRKDDTRLHVDAFPSRPMRGLRILRVFANVNPTLPREWRAGEPFEAIARRFLPGLRPPAPGSLAMLDFLKVTRGRRTLYDHYMLGLHDAMKADTAYQRECPQSPISFAPAAVWACFTDAVSHAAMSGQHAFEQTFYLPVEAMRDPALSPLRTLERLAGRRLV
jgi:hypothetical protein